ncbi:Cysteine-rich receptor-like protein kinase 25 [Artemisia annua]|uniref:Cysteine-rich receptor-like protein kinase 25 n=1 Tax=Artemisia annua TaxID=35608 RepID=A0A2U1KH31_ARTAN|nr:Cysteine-rich receptor-like protein kinase 25 [Artemisia annua]
MDIGMTESLRYNFSLVKAATNDFSENNKLGQGGFGAVYKGKLEDGQEIAVKRLATNSAQGDKEFKNEVLLVAKLQHRNLVRLLGFSIEGNERLLIYEFLQNASLDQIIFGKMFCTKDINLTLPDGAWKTWRNGTPLDMIDPTLNTGPGSLRTVIRSIHIGLLCVQENVDGRPTMASVVHMLNNISVTLPVPSEPAFFMHSNSNLEMPLLNEDNSSRTRLAQHSINVVSISEIVPR